METGLKHSEKKTSITEKENYKLSIQVSLNGLSFCVLHTASNTITDFISLTFDSKANPNVLLDKLKHEFNNNEALQHDFSELVVIHSNELSTLVPDPLFTEDHLADYLKFNAAILQTDYLTYDTLNDLEVKNVYVPFININNYIFEQFGSFKYYHSGTLLVQYMIPFAFKSNTTKAYVNISHDAFELIVFKEKKLLFNNRFEYRTKEDFIYYLMFTLEQLQLDPEQVEVVVSGIAATDDPLFEIAYKYIRNVSLFQPHIKYTLHPKVEKSTIPLTLLHSF